MRGRARAVITTSATVACAGAAYGLQISAGSAHGTAQGVEVGLGVLTAVLAAAIPLREQRLQVRERRVAEYLAAQATGELRVAISDVLEPLAKLLGDLSMAAGQHKKELVGVGKQSVVSAAAGIVGVERSRACFFREVTDATTGKRRLVPDVFAGRSGQPHTTFEEGTPAGDAALSMCDESRRLYCEDVDVSPPTGWSGTSSGYRTFVSVPVTAGSRTLGMLTVDALTPGDLADEEASRLIDALAHILAAILSA